MQILPSQRTSAPAGPAGTGLELAPFRGVRYASDRVSGLAEVTSPPYDVIFRDKEDQLMAADPHNVVRLILPRPAGQRPGGEYHEAALMLRQWLADGILVPDPVPALYLYEQALDGGLGDDGGPAVVVQRGLIGAVRLEPPEAGIVLPHEGVSRGPVQGRLELMEATQANLEPIFLLYHGDADSAARRITAAVAQTEPPLLEALPGDGLRHRLWAITSPADLAAIAADLAPRQALIADGHHRYAAYRALRERRREAGHGAGPWDYGLALLVDSAAYPPEIGAIHRVIGGMDIADAAKLAGIGFTVSELPGGTADVAGAETALERASASGPAFVVAGGERAFLLTDPDPEQAAAAMPDDVSPQWRALPYSVMQRLLVMRLWGLADDDATVRVVHHDASAAFRAAAEAAGVAILCGPMSAAEVYAVAARGEKVPRKSTSFAPKPRTGLVFRLFAES